MEYQKIINKSNLRIKEQVGNMMTRVEHITPIVKLNL